MASVTPKIKMFIFISMIALLINLSACCIALINSNPDINQYTDMSDEKNPIDTPSYQESNQQNITASNFAMATATSFLPFVDLINLAFLGLNTITNVFVGLVIIILGALKLFLLITMVTNFLPFWDV